MSQSTEGVGVTKALGERHLGVDDLLVSACVEANDLATTATDVTDHGADLVLGLVTSAKASIALRQLHTGKTAESKLLYDRSSCVGQGY